MEYVVKNLVRDFWIFVKEGVNMNVYAYIRELGGTKRDRNSSIEAQEEYLSRYAQRKGLLISEWIRDRDVSGTVPLKKRQNGARLVDSLKQGDAIICTEPGVLFSQPHQAASDIKEWESLGIEVHFVALGGEVLPKYTKLLLRFLSSMAAEEMLAKIEKSYRTKALLKGEGKITGGRPPFGFMVDKNGRSAFDSDKKRVINFMLEEYKNGRSYRWIGMAIFTHFNESLSANAVQRTIERFKDNPDLRKLLE